MWGGPAPPAGDAAIFWGGGGRAPTSSTGPPPRPPGGNRTRPGANRGPPKGFASFSQGAWPHREARDRGTPFSSGTRGAQGPTGSSGPGDARHFALALCSRREGGRDKGVMVRPTHFYLFPSKNAHFEGARGRPFFTENEFTPPRAFPPTPHQHTSATTSPRRNFFSRHHPNRGPHTPKDQHHSRDAPFPRHG